MKITGTIRDNDNTLVLKYVCALLNSGGGILHMQNLDAQVDAYYLVVIFLSVHSMKC